MTPEQAQRVQAVFEAALEVHPAERAVFLDTACGDEAWLKQEVASLLAALDEAGSFIEAPAVIEAPEVFTDERAESMIGRRIGAYQIIGAIGQGGMGAVYLAARADEHFQKRVALKVLKRGLETEDILRRFRHERQILASLDHPHIARLLDGGTTEDGLPYFVMEYIEGQPIDQYCDDHRLSITERLQLFRQVCAAVQYAHQNLIVHRDLKPSNMFITADGAPKLLDFGIAKVLNPDVSSPTVEVTMTGMRLMTPGYASPEQARGGLITTASDVYSLGVVLYELLTGHRPYHVSSLPPDEAARVICQQEPEKPSTAITRVEEMTTDGETKRITPESVSEMRADTPDRLRRRLSGDLDNIVLMALRKEPQRRYASVEQFSEDIRRHLDGLPVMARKDTLGYRAEKFIKRHRVGVAATVVIVLTLVGGVITTAWQARIAAEQRDKARVEATKAERINAFLQEMLGSADPNQKGREIKVAEVLDEAARRVETDLADQPEVAAAVRRTLGDTYRSLGLSNDAGPHLRAALDAHLKLFGAEHPETAKSQYTLALLLRFEGDFAGAEQLFRQALAVQRKTPSDKNPDLALTLFWLGELLVQKGEAATAEPFLNEALELTRRQFGSGHVMAAKTLAALGLAREYQGDLKGAETLDRQAIDVFRKLPGRRPVEMAATLANLGTNLTTQGEYAEAESVFRESAELSRTLLGDAHPNVSLPLIHLGRLYFLKGDYGKAEEEMRRALELQRRTLPEGHADLAQSTSLLGLILTRAGKPAQGEPYLREALDIRRKVLPEGSWLIPNVESALGECLLAQQRYVEAEPLLTNGYAGLKSSLGGQHPRTVEAIQRLVHLYDAWRKPTEAAEYRALQK